MGHHQEPPLNRIGIFVGYGKGIPLKGEGLGRLLAFVVSGLVQLPAYRLTIACPTWLAAELTSLLAEHGVGSETYDLLHVTKPTPSMMRNRSGSLADVRHPCVRASAVTLRRLWRTLRREGIRKAVRGVRKLARRIRRRNRSDDGLVEVRLLVHAINRQQAVRYWLVPTPFWPQASDIRHWYTMVFPDLVLQEFPLRFADPSTELTYARIVDAVQRAQRVICYSEHTKMRQVVHGVGLSPEQVDVIGHARVDLSSHLSPSGAASDPAERRRMAIAVLHTMEHAPSRARRRMEPNWPCEPYLFYASQYRGHKNILALLRAIAILRHRQAAQVRLVLTCDRKAGSELDRALSLYDLDARVLFTPRVSDRELAALYTCAAAAVNPTLFEGGFPFTFTEAFSVGTPSLMSDIPLVRERVVDPSLRARMLFDPLDPQDLADKIQWSLGNRDRLLEMQRPLYESFPTWTTVAQRYCDSLTCHRSGNGTEDSPCSGARAP